MLQSNQRKFKKLTAHGSRIDFDTIADVTIVGNVGGRKVEYSGKTASLKVIVDDNCDNMDWFRDRFPLETTSYSLALEQVDGKQLTVKIGKKKIVRTAATYYPSESLVDKRAIERCRVEVDAPARATSYFEHDDIVFTWTEEIQ